MAGEIHPELPEVLGSYFPQEDWSAIAIQSLGKGNINLTYRVTGAGQDFVLQCISGAVFPEPLHVIDNFSLISEHLHLRRLVEDCHFSCSRPIKTISGNLYYKDKLGKCWRAQEYLPHSSSVTVLDAEQAFSIGRVLAQFHHLLSDMDTSQLVAPIPGFHDLSAYLQKFDMAWQNHGKKSGSEVAFCWNTLDFFRQMAGSLEKARKNGVLTPQTIHGDPKLDNFIFSAQGIARGLFDLDTVGAGIVHHDLGDCLRSCCNLQGEAGNQAPQFDLGLCKAILEGYLTHAGGHFSREQRRLIFEGVLLICFELAVRFFTDHLCGDTYFNVSYSGENLHRACRQFELVYDIASKKEQIIELALAP